jgi:hypothetical protein
MDFSWMRPSLARPLSRTCDGTRNPAPGFSIIIFPSERLPWGLVLPALPPDHPVASKARCRALGLGTAEAGRVIDTVGGEKVSNPPPAGFVIVNQQNTQRGHGYVPLGREQTRSFGPRSLELYFSLTAGVSWFLIHGGQRCIQSLPYGLSMDTLAKSRGT